MTTTNNPPKNLAAFRAILADPRGVLLAQDAGTAAVMRLAEIRVAVRVLAAKPKTGILSLLGETPDAARMGKLFAAAREAEADANHDATAQVLNNGANGALGALAILAACNGDADGWAGALAGLSNAALRHLGSVLRQAKGTKAPMPASWADALAYVRQWQADADDKAAERRAKARDAAGAGEDDAGDASSDTGRATRAPDAGLPAPDETAMRAALVAMVDAAANMRLLIAGLGLSKAKRAPLDLLLDEQARAAAVLGEQLTRLADCEM